MTLHKDATKSTSMRFLTLEDSLHRLHSSKYTYELSVIKNSREKFIVCCPVHGVFKTTLNNHASEKNPCGCKQCAIDATALLATRTYKSFVEDAVVIHSNMYTYSSEYVCRNTKVTIKCLKCNNIFLQTPTAHLAGQGCPSCAYSGFRNDKPAILYYLQLSETLFKVGITNRTVAKRYSVTDRDKFTTLLTKQFDKGIDAYNYEQYLLHKYVKHQYTGPAILKSGNTELFTVDILCLESAHNEV